jgi:hypothetical protein
MRIILSSILVLSVATQGVAQTAVVTAADYDRARGLAAKYRQLVTDAIEAPTWSGNSDCSIERAWLVGTRSCSLTSPIATHRSSAPPLTTTASPRALGAVTGGRYTGVTLPFNSYAFANNDQAITFAADSVSYTCSLTAYTCARAAAGAGVGRGGRGGGGGGAGPTTPDIGLTVARWQAHRLHQQLQRLYSRRWPSAEQGTAISPRRLGRATRTRASH